MLFKPELAQKIVAGQKTQTRRLVHPDDFSDETLVRRWKPNRSNPTTTMIRWGVGRTYAICPGRGKPQIGRILILNIRSEYINSITEADARREGFASRQEFLDTFKSINPKSKPDDRVWVIDFKHVDNR